MFTLPTYVAKAGLTRGGSLTNFTGVVFGHYLINGRTVSKEEYQAYQRGDDGDKPKGKPAGKRKPAEPPPLPGHKPTAAGKRPPRPGTGQPPGKLGAPSSPQEVIDQQIWLLGRAGMIREHVRDNAHRLTPEQKQELTKKVKLAVHLANRLRAGQFQLPTVAKKDPAKGKPAKGRKPSNAPKDDPKADPFAEALGRPTEKPADPRHNPLLDEAFAAPTPQPATPQHADLRHNPDLDEVFGEPRKRAAKSLAWLPPPAIVE